MSEIASKPTALLARLIRTAAADNDLISIAVYGAERWGSDAAFMFVNTFERAFLLLSQHPDIGRPRDEIDPGIRSWLHRGYVIYYAHASDEVTIGRILHGAADLPASIDFEP